MIVDESAENGSVAYAASILSVIVTFYNSKTRLKVNRNSNHQSEDDEVNVEVEETNLVFPGENYFK